MNIIVKFFHQLLNPHCEHCADLRQTELDYKRESEICDTCEVLKSQLAIANNLNNELIGKLTVDRSEPPSVPNPNPTPIMPNYVPFRVRRQQLEREDRIRAKALRDEEGRVAESLLAKAPKPAESSKTNEELESEIGINSESEQENAS